MERNRGETGRSSIQGSDYERPGFGLHKPTYVELARDYRELQARFLESQRNDAHALVASVRRRLLVLAADTCGIKFQGLAQATKHLGLSSAWRRRGRELDATLGIVEKISQASCDGYVREFSRAVKSRSATNCHRIDSCDFLFGETSDPAERFEQEISTSDAMDVPPWVPVTSAVPVVSLCFDLFESERVVACTQMEQKDHGVNDDDQCEGCVTMWLQVAFLEEKLELLVDAEARFLGGESALLDAECLSEGIDDTNLADEAVATAKKASEEEAARGAEEDAAAAKKAAMEEAVRLAEEAAAAAMKAAQEEAERVSVEEAATAKRAAVEEAAWLAEESAEGLSLVGIIPPFPFGYGQGNDKVKVDRSDYEESQEAASGSEINEEADEAEAEVDAATIEDVPTAVRNEVQMTTAVLDKMMRGIALTAAEEQFKCERWPKRRARLRC